MNILIKKAKEIRETLTSVEGKISELEKEINLKNYKEICEFISEFKDLIEFTPIESYKNSERQFETVDSITWRNTANKYKNYKQEEFAIAKGIKVSKTVPVIVQNGLICNCQLYIMDDGEFYMLDNIHNRKGINGPINPSEVFAGEFITGLYPELSNYSWDLNDTKQILIDVLQDKLKSIEEKYGKLKETLN